MTDINPDAELRHKIHHIIETMDQEKYGFLVLTKGYRAIVDQKFYENIQPYRWHAVVSPNQAGSVYARTTQIKRDGVVTLHNYVLSLYLHGKYDPSVKHVTFNNKLTLDCRLVNLLKNTGRQAVMRHRLGKSKTTSEFKGVRKRPQKNAKDWRVQIHDGEKTIHLGQYDSEVYAAKVYDAAAETLFGASAYLNFPDGSIHQEHRYYAKIHLERHFNKQKR